ncbi:hypothetical protein PV328_011965, partial [Microctonus aethiopoides]
MNHTEMRIPYTKIGFSMGCNGLDRFEWVITYRYSIGINEEIISELLEYFQIGIYPDMLIDLN